MVDNFIYRTLADFYSLPRLNASACGLPRGKRKCSVACVASVRKKKEVGRCITGRNSPTISVPQIHTVCRTSSVSTLGFILDFPGIWVLCVSFRFQRQNVPSPTPPLNSSRSLIQRLLPWTHFSPLHIQPHYSPSLTLLYFSSEHSTLSA